MQLNISKKKLIIFQSPADMADGLSILKSISSTEIDIAVIGSIGLFESLNSYHKNVIYLSPPALSKGLFKYIAWFYLKKKENIKFIKSYDEIFYPDLLNDVLTSVLIKNAKNKNIIITKYVSRYNVLLGENITNLDLIDKVKSQILSYILKTVSGIKEFKIVKYNDRFMPYCMIEPDKILKIKQKKISKKNINLKIYNDLKLNYLFLDPGPGVHDILINYYEVIHDVLKKLSEKGHLYIKKHPTHPLSLENSLLDELEFRYLEENLPISMINLEGIDHVVAIESIGLTEVQDIIPISIINLFKERKTNYKEIYINYMQVNSAKNILFPDNMASFNGIINFE